MSNLSAFLHPVTVQEEKEIVISRRFLDEDGNPAKFKIRSVNQEEMDSIIKLSTHPVKGNSEGEFDGLEFNKRLIVAATVTPDFRSTELCNAYGVMDPLMVPGKMLFSGEYSKLLKAITDLSSINTPVEDEAKN